MKKESVFVKVFALWLLSFWFVAVAYSFETGDYGDLPPTDMVSSLKGVDSETKSVKKEVICKDDFYWLKKVVDEESNWQGLFRFECFKKGGKTQCYINTETQYDWNKVMPLFDKSFVDDWIRNHNRATTFTEWFNETLDRLYKENCKEVEF